MYLIIDLGNTLAKLFLYNQDRCILQEKFPNQHFAEKVAMLIDNYEAIQGVIYSDVSDTVGSFFEKYLGRFPVLKVHHDMRLPFTNLYESPESLGSDRLVLATAACVLYPHSNVLVIDLGTCITYDFITADHCYQGGAISPGFEMRYRALHDFTEALPNLKPEVVYHHEGKSTEASVHVGVYFGILDEIKARISHYESKYDLLTVILTGGDANKLPKTLKNSIFAHSNFTAEGMLHLLKLNLDS